MSALTPFGLGFVYGSIFGSAAMLALVVLVILLRSELRGGGAR